MYYMFLYIRNTYFYNLHNKLNHIPHMKFCKYQNRFDHILQSMFYNNLKHNCFYTHNMLYYN